MIVCTAELIQFAIVPDAWQGFDSQAGEAQAFARAILRSMPVDAAVRLRNALNAYKAGIGDYPVPAIEIARRAIETATFGKPAAPADPWLSLA